MGLINDLLNMRKERTLEKERLQKKAELRESAKEVAILPEVFGQINEVAAEFSRAVLEDELEVDYIFTFSQETIASYGLSFLRQNIVCFLEMEGYPVFTTQLLDDGFKVYINTFATRDFGSD